MGETHPSEDLDDDAELEELHAYEDAVTASFAPADWDVLWAHGYDFSDVMASRVPGVDPRDLYDQMVAYAGEADAAFPTVDLSALRDRQT